MNLGEYILTSGKQVSFKRCSYFALKPGDIVMFQYDEQARLGMIVSSGRTASGLFLSTQLNSLLNMFLMEGLSMDKFQVAVNILYKNRTRCSYHGSPTILGSLFGQSNFRTFDVSRIKGLYQVLIK